MPGVVVNTFDKKNHSCDINVDAELGECTLDDDDKWGFKITGGITFGMPVTIFYVKKTCFFFCIIESVS